MVANSVDFSLMSNPASAAMDWMTCITASERGLLDMVTSIVNGRLHARLRQQRLGLGHVARRRSGSPWRNRGWPARKNWLPGVNCPSNTTWLTRVAVDRELQRLAHALVLAERRLGAVAIGDVDVIAW